MGYHPQTGKRIRKRCYAHTRREAYEKLEDMRDKYRVVTHVDADTITTGEWLVKWFETFVRAKIRENTARTYWGTIEIAIEELGDIKLDKLTDVDLQAVIFGPLRQKYRTAKNFRFIMKGALRRAVKSRLLKESPAEDLELPPKPERRPFAKPSKENWQKLLDYEDASIYCWRWILLTEFVTGARLSELLGLQWDDFTFERDKQGRITGGTVHIQRAIIVGSNESFGEKRQILIRPTKTAQSNRVLPLPADYCQEMMRYRKVQLEQRMLVENYHKTPFVFTQWTGDPLSPNSFSSRFSMIRKKLGVKSTFHMLRHDMASRMKSTHLFDLKDIQTQLGHSSIQITMDIYTHIDEEEKAKVSSWLATGVDALLKKPI